MRSKLVQTALVDIGQPKSPSHSISKLSPRSSSTPEFPSPVLFFRGHLHARRTPRNLPPFLHTVQLPPSIRLSLTLHVVVIVGFTSRSDKERRAHKGCRARSDFFNLGDVLRHGRRVNEHICAEPVERRSVEESYFWFDTYLASRFAMIATAQANRKDCPEPVYDLVVRLRRLRQVNCGASTPSERCRAESFVERKNYGPNAIQYWESSLVKIFCFLSSNRCDPAEV